MNDNYTYLDSSALMKLVVVEEESEAVRTYLEAHSKVITSGLARSEVQHAAMRVSHAHLAVSRQLLARMMLIALDEQILDHAGQLGPPALRTLDCIHVASALSLGSHLDAFMTYDLRQAHAAREWGLNVVTPH